MRVMFSSLFAATALATVGFGASAWAAGDNVATTTQTGASNYAYAVQTASGVGNFAQINQNN